MTILVSHIARLVIDLILFAIMLELDLYEFTNTFIILIVFRLIIGHFGRIFQYVLSLADDFDGLIAGFLANGIKTTLESIILLSLYKDEDISNDVIAIIIICILARNTFEAVSLCEDFSE